MKAPNISFNATALAARGLLAALLVPAGSAKLAGFGGVLDYIASKGVPLPQVAAASAIGIELGMGLLLAGLHTRWAALGLAIFVSLITPVFHRFWGLPPEQVMLQQRLLFKNVGIVGGLLMLIGFGAGRWSADEPETGSAASSGPLVA